MTDIDQNAKPSSGTMADDRTRTERTLDVIADRLHDVLLELRVGNIHDLLDARLPATTPQDPVDAGRKQERSGSPSRACDLLGAAGEVAAR